MRVGCTACLGGVQGAAEIQCCIECPAQSIKGREERATVHTCNAWKYSVVLTRRAYDDTDARRGEYLRICIPRPAKAILTRIYLLGDHCRQD